jgi:hypothetical protein
MPIPQLCIRCHCCDSSEEPPKEESINPAIHTSNYSPDIYLEAYAGRIPVVKILWNKS